MKRTGKLITFEGIDGSGKSLQLKMADKFLKKSGYKTITLREPGSTPLSERIRRILLDKRLNINPISELLLYVAARTELVNESIIPELDNGTIILCDRFYDSTAAYQGYGRGLDLKLIYRLNKEAAGTAKPDLTLVIDVDYKTSLSRRKKSPDRLEKESKKFFERVRFGFHQIAKQEKNRVKLINGAPEPEIVFEDVKQWLMKKLKI